MTLMLLGLSSLINGWLVGSVEENVGEHTRREEVWLASDVRRSGR
jgi:hypothetical protein